MKVKFATVTITYEDKELPDNCPECGEFLDGYEAEEVAYGRTQYTYGGEPEGGDMPEYPGDGACTGFFCRECGHEL